MKFFDLSERANSAPLRYSAFVGALLSVLLKIRYNQVFLGPGWRIDGPFP
jgi:hypothetical protein